MLVLFHLESLDHSNVRGRNFENKWLKTAKYTYTGGRPKERSKSLFTVRPTADHYCLNSVVHKLFVTLPFLGFWKIKIVKNPHY